MRHYIYLLVILRMLHLVQEVDAFGRPRSIKHNRKSAKTATNCNLNDSRGENSSVNKSSESTAIDYNPYYNCGLLEFGVVQKIPYQSGTSAHGPTVVNFSSACVRCGICLAIADRIHEKLLEAHDAMPSSQWLEDEEADLYLRTICENEFKHYALREIDGERYLGDSLPGALAVASTADEKWATALQSKCNKILKDVGTLELYKQWRTWCDGATKEFIDFLCRGESGELRDCRSIDGDSKKPDNCNSVYRARIKVTAELT